MNIEVSNETSTDVPLAEITAVCTHVFNAMHIHPAAEVEVRFIAEDAMAQLHEEWMNLPGPTDVMSFPMDELRPGNEQSLTTGILGDIVICPAVAAAQAQAAGHATIDELLLLTVHGLLHLLGYDHEDEADRTEMFALQRRLLLTFFAARYNGRTDVPEPTEG